MLGRFYVTDKFLFELQVIYDIYLTGINRLKIV